MDQEYVQKRCNVDNALLFEVSKDGTSIQIKCRKCGSIRAVKLILPPPTEEDFRSPLALKSELNT